MALLNSTTVEGNLTVKELLNIVEELKVNNGLILNVNNNQFTYKGANVITDAGGTGGVVPITVQFASQLKIPRTISFTGDATGSVSFDGSQNVSVNLTHRDTSNQASITTTAPTMIQNISLDTMGHVTGLTTYNLDNRYYTNTQVTNYLNNKTDKTIQVVAGKGLTGGGDLSTNRTVNVVSADDGLIINEDNIKLNIENSVTSTSITKPASANSVNVSYTKANEAVTLANTKVNKAGDVMTGALTLTGFYGNTITHNSPGSLRFGNTGANYSLGVIGSNGNWTLNKFSGDTFQKTVFEIPNSGTALKFDSARIYHENFKPTKTDIGLGSVNNWLASSAINDESTNTYATTKGVKLAYDKGQEALTLAQTKADKSIQIIAGQGISGGGTLNNNVTFNLASSSAGLVVGTDSIGLSIVNDLTTGGVDKPASAETVVTLKKMIDALQNSGGSGSGSGGSIDIGSNEQFGERRFAGNLLANATDINLSTLLYHPELYIGGTKIPQELFTVELNVGHIKLKAAYDVSYPWEYEVIDKYPFHIKFSYPTLNLLIAQTQIKNSVKLGDVIKILGETNVDDGGSRLIKCENTKGLNGVDIGNGRFLNEIPETRMNTKLDKGNYSGNAQDLKNGIDSKEPTITKKSGFNLNKTDEVENDTNKVFTAFGALNLKNWLVSNYTTLMNNIRESLTTLINGKLSHGGYSGTGQDLKNLADSKVSKAGDTLTGALKLTGDESLVSSKGLCSSYTISLASKTGFDVGDGTGEPVLASGSSSSFVKGYSIGSVTSGKGYLSRSVLGHYRTGDNDWGCTQLYFRGDSGVEKIWTFNHTTGEFKAENGYLSDSSGRVFTPGNRPKALSYLLANNVREFTFDFNEYDYFIVAGSYSGSGNVQTASNCIMNTHQINEISSVGVTSAPGYSYFNWRGYKASDSEGNKTRTLNTFKATVDVTGCTVWGVRLS